MIEGIPRISVVVITYKQENIIGRTLESLIAQRDYLYEICVSDDCSPDNTWDVLKKYQENYPDLLKIHRNEKNLGIFENTEYSWTMPTGDVVYEIAGDDAVPDGWYKRVVEFIQKNNVDWKNELFCIYGDFKVVYPNGDSMIFSNKAIIKKPNEALRLAFRGTIGGRGCCFSKKVLDKFEKVSQGRSHRVEHAQDRQKQINSEKNYYIPYVANIYNAGIGVSSRIDEDTFNERQQLWDYTFEYLKKRGIKLSEKDINYGQYIIAIDDFRRHLTFSGFIQIIKSYFNSRDFSLPSGNGFKHLMFAIIRRFPHKKPITF